MTKETPAVKEAKTVYQAIAAVQGDLAKVGIAKDQKNTQQNYNFRGIDGVYNALASLLSTHGLCILPRVLKREVTERHSTKTYNNETKTTVLFYVAVEVEFDFVSASDGSTHVVKTFGEAMDSGDKATNKAMSAAYKYACLQAFCIPTEGDNDADGTTHEVVVKSVFESPAVRQMFLDNTAIAIDKAESKESLNEIIALNKAKFDEIRAGGNPEDIGVADKLNAAYRAKLATFVKPKTEDAPKTETKPATVEDAMKSKMDKVLGDDAIKY